VLYIFGVMKIVTHSPWRHSDSEQEYGSAPTVKGFKARPCLYRNSWVEGRVFFDASMRGVRVWISIRTKRSSFISEQ